MKRIILLTVLIVATLLATTSPADAADRSGRIHPRETLCRALPEDSWLRAIAVFCSRDDEPERADVLAGYIRLLDRSAEEAVDDDTHFVAADGGVWESDEG